MKNIHYKSIGEYLADVGKPAPEHPLFTIISVNTDTSGTQLDCPDFETTITTDFYAISLKNVIEGKVLYGKTRYDCSDGTMLFLAPNQAFSTQGIKIKSEGRLILIHPDYFVGHPLSDSIRHSDFFDYSVNEALHLSSKEEQLVAGVFDSILQEYQSHYDDCSREIILSYVKTLLSYGQRFYKRQFIQRRELNDSLFTKFTQLLEHHFNQPESNGLPVLSDIADCMRLSNRYLSDALKSETGKSAKECMQQFIIDRAKAMLINSNTSITSVAYDLGFDSPQYFVRLFKKKTDMTPTEFRDSLY